MLDRVEPVRIGARVFQEPVARTQRALKRVDARHVVGIDRQHEAIEKAPALGGRTVEQLVHGGDEPDHPQVVGERGGRRHRLAIDAALARRLDDIAGRGLDPGAERREAERTIDIRRHRPGTVAFREGDIVERGAPQSPSRRQERDRLDEVGLAGAVRPDQHRRRRANLDLRGVVAAKIRQRQAADAGGGCRHR